MNNLKTYDKDNIPEATIKKLQKYITDENMQVAAVERASTATKGLCVWLHAMNMYHKVAKGIGPKRELLAQANAQLEDAMQVHEKCHFAYMRSWKMLELKAKRERSNNTSGLLTGPEYSSDDIGDGPPVDDADLDELSRRVASNDVRVSAIGHNLVDHEQAAAFEALSDRPSPTALHIMDDGGRDEDEHLAHHLASLDKRPCNPSSFNQPRRAERRIDIPPATVIGRKYRINQRIASGSFSEIYSATVIGHGHNFCSCTNCNKQVAIKFEKRSARCPQLRHEFKVYRELQGCTGIGRVMYYGTYRDRKFGVDCNVMVMELLGGPSLEDLFNYCGRRFSLKTTLQLADKLLERAETLHENHLIHRDITPANFVVSPGETAAEVFCIDFGLSKRYRHPQTLQHIAYREDRSLTGTPRYASVAKHQGKEASRRDDLESIGYMLVYFSARQAPLAGPRGAVV